jgi:hypothetical protein
MSRVQEDGDGHHKIDALGQGAGGSCARWLCRENGAGHLNADCLRELRRYRLHGQLIAKTFERFRDLRPATLDAVDPRANVPSVVVI